MMDQTRGHPVVFAAPADLQRLPEGVGDHAGVLEAELPRGALPSGWPWSTALVAGDNEGMARRSWSATIQRSLR